MIDKRCFFLLLILITAFAGFGFCEDAPAKPADESAKEPQPDKQLVINRDALLNGSANAAAVMLFDSNPMAREILINTLKQPENAKGRQAICQALGQNTKATPDIPNKKDFAEPLLEILTSGDDKLAKLAAEAILIFKYHQISNRLKKIIDDKSKPINAKLYILYAMARQSDPKAIIELIKLVDSSDKEVAKAAGEVLKSSGMPVGENKRDREQIIKGIERQGRDVFIEFWKIRKETEARINELRKEMQWWQSQYLTSLEQIYGLLADDVQKGKFLADHLQPDKKMAVKLWALRKIGERLKGTNPKLPDELGPILIGLISDSQRDIRLKTAEVLMLKRDLNSAAELLKQLEAEKDDEIKMKLFMALGGVCHYSLLPDASFKVNPEIRQKTLDLAAGFLKGEDTKKAQKAAEVMRRLLEKDGLKPKHVQGYLNLLVNRYKKQSKADGILRAALLEAMAGLCAQSVYKAEAVEIFKPLFEQALTDEADYVREAAVDGLINIDKTKALAALKAIENDENKIVREKLINLKSEVGGEEDLEWLVSRIGNGPESDLAFKAMHTIFNRSKAAVSKGWLVRLNSKGAKLSQEQKTSFLLIAHQKALGEKDIQMLKDVRDRLAKAYVQNKQYEEAAKYLAQLADMAKESGNDEERQAFLDELLNVYMEWPKAELAVSLIANRLSERDLGPQTYTVKLVETYLTKFSGKAESLAMLKALIAIKVPGNRPGWLGQQKIWTDRLSAAQKAAEPAPKPKEKPKEAAPAVK
jgi:HEAT repeat protein